MRWGGEGGGVPGWGAAEGVAQGGDEDLSKGRPVRAGLEDVALVHLQLDADIHIGRQALAKPAGQAVALASVGVDAADDELGGGTGQGGLPAPAQHAFARATGA